MSDPTDYPPTGEPLGDEEPRSRLLDGVLPDMVKKLAMAGVGALFMTEEGVRNMVTEMKLPREAVTGLISQTEKARAELFKVVAVELRTFLEHSNLAGELSKALIGLSVDVQATINFRQSPTGGASPTVSVSVAKSSDEDAPEE